MIIKKEEAIKTGPFWEMGYSEKKVSTMGGPSVEVYEILPLLPPGGSVLDLGCGEGRNAIYLAQRGFNVTAVDHSEFAIEKVKHVAESLDLDVKTEVADLNDFKCGEQYDLVLAHGVLHFLDNEGWKNLLGILKNNTVPGGIHSFSIFVFNRKYPLLKEIKAAGYKSSFAIDELKEFYKDWDVLRYDKYAKWDKHPGIPMHVHPVEKIIAVKAHEEGSEYHYTNEVIIDQTSSITEEAFLEIEIGITEETLVSTLGEADVVNTVDFGQNAVGAEKTLLGEYILKDLFYGDKAFQFINGELRGKYIYETNPRRLKIKSDT